MSHDEAWAIISNFFDHFNDDSNGLTVWQASDESWMLWKSALSVLSTPPTNGMLARALVERAFGTLRVHLEIFQSSLVNSELNLDSISNALQTLYLVFQCIQVKLQECCECLMVLEVSFELAASMRCFILQPDLITGEEPVGKREFIKFLSDYAQDILAQDLGQKNGKQEDQKKMEENSSFNDVPIFSAVTKPFSNPSQILMLYCLHGLMLSSSQEIKDLWRIVLEICVKKRIDSLREVFNMHFIRECLLWEEEVVEPFIKMALPPTCDGDNLRVLEFSSLYKDISRSHFSMSFNDATLTLEKKLWCEDFRRKIFVMYARNRIQRFWDIMVEYPDSIPTLQDIQYCLYASEDDNLKVELLQYVRNLLSVRLHRAGISTEDILEVLSKTIGSLCVLLSRSEQGALLTVISDTLEHIRRRKDCISEILKIITQPNIDPAISTEDRPYSFYHEQADRLSLGNINIDDHCEDDCTANQQKGMPKAFDTLRILSAIVSVKSLVHGYERTLAQRLLGRPLHTFDVTSEEEKLERLKCVLGEDALRNCMVMLWDVQMSKRTTQQIREKKFAKGSPSDRYLNSEKEKAAEESFLLPHAVSVDVLSPTIWGSFSHSPSVGMPVAAPEQYILHPTLQNELDILSKKFKSVKINQKLTWILSQGRVALEIDQLDASDGYALRTTSRVLPLFLASVLLHLKDLEGETLRNSKTDSASDPIYSTIPIPIDKLAARVGLLIVDKLLLHLKHLSPSLLIIHPDGRHISIQKLASNASNIVFKTHEEDLNDEESSDLSSLQIKTLSRMIISKLKATSAQSFTEIHNSVMKFVDFRVRIVDIKGIMQTLLSEGSVVCTDGRHYSLRVK